MPVTVTMPQLGESVTEGTITRWLKAVGDTVAADEPLLEVSTDKVDTEIPAPASGVLLSIDATEDDTVEVGGVLAVIGEPDDAAAVPSSEPSEPSEPVVADTPAEPAAPAEAAPSEPATPEPATPGPATPGPAIPEPVSSGSEVSVVLPALGESVTEGVITRWLKSVGDAVDADRSKATEALLLSLLEALAGPGTKRTPGLWDGAAKLREAVQASRAAASASAAPSASRTAASCWRSALFSMSSFSFCCIRSPINATCCSSARSASA